MQKSLLVLILLLIAAVVTTWFVRLPTTKFVVRGDLYFIDKAAIKDQMLPWQNASIALTNISNIQSKLNSHPWIKRSSVIRIWPDTIEIAVVEAKPIAIWKATKDLDCFADYLNCAYITDKYQYALNNKIITEHTKIPQLISAEKQKHKIREVFIFIRQQLAAVNIEINTVVFEADGSLNLVINDAITAKLGSKNFEQKLKNLTVLWQKQLVKFAKSINSLDLRYRDGIAVEYL